MLEVKWEKRVHLTALGTRGQTKFYSAGVVSATEGNGPKQYVPVFAWGSGFPVCDFSRGQTKVLMTTNGWLTAVGAINDKLAEKRRRGYSERSVPEDREHMPYALEAEIVGRVRGVSTEVTTTGVSSTPVHLMTRSELLAVKEWDADHLIRAVEVRQELVATIAEFYRGLDANQAELQLLDAKITSAI